jgi:hypothetical protein
MTMTPLGFVKWLDRYGSAWTNGDPDAVIQLFASEAAYYETPFGQPMVGAEAIRRYWTDGAQNGQRGVKFAATPIAINDQTGFAHWQATFQRVGSNVFVELDGILSARFDEMARCVEFREWWHRKRNADSADS